MCLVSIAMSIFLAFPTLILIQEAESLRQLKLGKQVNTNDVKAAEKEETETCNRIKTELVILSENEAKLREAIDAKHLLENKIKDCTGRISTFDAMIAIAMPK